MSEAELPQGIKDIVEAIERLYFARNPMEAQKPKSEVRGHLPEMVSKEKNGLFTLKYGEHSYYSGIAGWLERKSRNKSIPGSMHRTKVRRSYEEMRQFQSERYPDEFEYKDCFDFTVHPDGAGIIVAAIDEDIPRVLRVAQKEEAAFMRAKAKKALEKEFDQILHMGKILQSSWLAKDLSERTPGQLTREAKFACQLLDPITAIRSPEACQEIKDMFNNLQDLNKDKLFSKKELAEKMNRVGVNFISFRNLKPTMKELNMGQ